MSNTTVLLYYSLKALMVILTAKFVDDPKIYATFNDWYL